MFNIYKTAAIAALRRIIVSSILITAFFSTSASATNFIQLKVEDSIINWDQFLLIFDPNSTARYDTLKDGLKFYNPDLNFYSLSDDSVRLCNDRRPYLNGLNIRMGLTTPYKQTCWIRVSQYNIPYGISLYLKDKYTNTTTLLSYGLKYYFTVDNNSQSQGNDRFVIMSSGYPKLLPPDAVITKASCAGCSDGAISVTVNGGVKPFVCLWNNGATTKDISNLAAGEYSILIKDSVGDSIRARFTVKQPIELYADLVNVSCTGCNNGDIYLNVKGGRQPYLFQWNNGKTTKDLVNTTAGTYKVLVTDSLSDTISASYMITQPVQIKGTIAVNPIYTVGGQASYTIYKGYGPQSVELSGTASGGVGVYKYSWSPVTGVTNPDAATTNVTPDVTTTYILTIKDSLGNNTTVSQTINVDDIKCGNDKVRICHKQAHLESSICVNIDAVSAHLSHGDKLGNCTNNKELFTIVPNPNYGVFKIQLLFDSEGDLVITDIMGRNVMTRHYEPYSELSLDLSENKKGLYILHVNNGNETYCSRFMMY
jgi:hypothetical protein